MGQGRRTSGETTIQFDAARQMNVPVYFAVGWPHLQHDGIIHPIAGAIGMQCSIGDGG